MRKNVNNIPGLLPDESIILTDSAFLKNSMRSGWKPGHLFLTNRRLVLHQPARNIFETSLETILSISTEKKGFILRSVDALGITFANPKNATSSRVWIVVEKPENWQKEIFSRTRLQVAENDIEKIASELGPESRAILLHIWERRHATISELWGLYSAPQPAPARLTVGQGGPAGNHMDVLQKIRDIINPTSEKAVGFPILVFERSKTDPETGENIPFSWWIIGNRKSKDTSPEPLMDVFEEEDHIVFVMELRGIQEEDIQIQTSGDHLKFMYNSPARKYSEDILLPSVVDPDTIERRYHNGILEVKLQKSLGEGVGVRYKTLGK